MKRRLTKLVLFLLLGAIVNVAVAWGCASSLVFGYGYASYESLAPETAKDRIVRALDIPVSAAHELQFNGGSYRSFGWTMLKISPRSRMASGGLAHYRLEQRSAGWPYRSLSGEWYFDEARTPLAGRSRWLVGGEDLLMPMRPTWPGFVVDTVFYATLFWLLSTSFALHRVIRRKRGRCIKCGYDLRGAEHDVCPECGHEVSAKVGT